MLGIYVDIILDNLSDTKPHRCLGNLFVGCPAHELLGDWWATYMDKSQ